MTARPRVRSLRTRLLLYITATLVVVCAAMALTTVFAQRAYLLDNLDDRVGDAAERSLGGASIHPTLDTNLGFLHENGQPAGMLAARLDDKGAIVAGALVGQDKAPLALTAAQRGPWRASPPTVRSTPVPSPASARTASPRWTTTASASWPASRWTTYRT